MKQIPGGMLIALEGIDGSGKSTLARALAEKFREAGYEVVLTKEPGGSNAGKALREVLQHTPLVAKAEFLLFSADRAQHVQEVIKPALQRGALVISDRMLDSTYAYQGYGRGLDMTMLRTVTEWVMEGIKPQMVLYCALESTQAQDRIMLRSEQLTTFEQEKKEFFDRVAHGFDTLLRGRSDVHILDASQAPEDVCNQGYVQVARMLEQREVHG